MLDRVYGKSDFTVVRGRKKASLRSNLTLPHEQGQVASPLESVLQSSHPGDGDIDDETLEIQKQIAEEKKAHELQSRRITTEVKASVTEDVNKSSVRSHHHSKVWDRVQTSNRRVQKVTWGHNLDTVIKEEQFQEILYKSKRRSQLINEDFTFIENYKTRSRGKEKIFYGAKVVLQSKSDELYMGSNGELARLPGRFFLINLDDPTSTAPVFYGERVGLLAHNGSKALGTKLKLSSDGLRITMVANDERAVFTAKWKVIDPDDVSSSILSQRTKKTLSHGDFFGLRHNDFAMVIRKGEIVLENRELDHRHELSRRIINTKTASGSSLSKSSRYAVSSPSSQQKGSSTSASSRSLAPGKLNTSTESSDQAFDLGAIWQIHLYSNASVKKVPNAQRVLMRAQSQIRSVKERCDDQREFTMTLRREMTKYAVQSDVQYLIHDPTSLRHQDSDGIQKYFLRRLDNAFAAQNEAQQRANQIREQAAARIEREERERLDAINRARKPPKLTALENAKAMALAHRAEALVPAIVWQHVRAQEALSLVSERERREAAARRIQIAFRKWKQGQWTRAFQTLDLRCKAQITTREEFQIPIFRTNNTENLEIFVKPQFVQDDHTPAYLKWSRKKKNEALKNVSSLNPKILADCESTIKEHFGVLRHSNPALFSEIPECILRPTLPALESSILDYSSTSQSKVSNNADEEVDVIDEKGDHPRGIISSSSNKLARCSSAKLYKRRYSASASALARPHSAAQTPMRRSNTSGLLLGNQ